MNKNRLKDKVFAIWGMSSTFFGIVILMIFVGDIFVEGVTRINGDFFTSLPSMFHQKAGIKPAILGSLWILGLTLLIAFPIGVGAGIYLEEYGRKNWLSNLLEINISNLAGVPSIIYGLLGLEIFVRILGLGKSLLSGALTLSLLILPIIIVATREAIKAVPSSIKQASFALGATKWQTIWNQVLPASTGGILTGVILALSRAIGETAPLIVVGAAVYVSFVPETPMDEYTVMPIQIFDWISRPQNGFKTNAAAAIIVLLFVTLVMNAIAVYYRNKWQKKVKW